MKLKTRLVATFFGVCIIGLISSVVGIFKMEQMIEASEKAYAMDMVGQSVTKESNIDLLYVSRSIRNAIVATSAEQRAKALAEVDQSMVSLQSHLDAARPLYWTENGQAQFAQLDTFVQDYKRTLDGLKAQIAVSPLQQASPVLEYMFKEFSPAVSKMDEYLSQLAEAKDTNGKNFVQSNRSSYETARMVMLSLVAISLVLGTGIGAWFAHVLVRRLGAEPQEVADLARRVAECDLSAEIRVEQDDHHSIMSALKDMQTRLAQVVAEVRTASESVAAASSQIAMGNSDLSQRTEEQANALQQTAAGMEELSSIMRQNAESAIQASQLAKNSSAVAAKGGEVVAQVVETMKGINESSKKIADIISVIDGIAFQTNILALNAAVEAARAGDQGRGFAVVATEVRSLAGRSAEAAKEIKNLINASVQRVEHGSLLVDQAGSTMTEVVASIRRATDMMGEISSSNTEQDQGMTQISQTMVEIDTITQKNVGLVEEMATAAGSLQDQAQELVGTVSVFRLGTNQRPQITGRRRNHAPVPALEGSPA